MYLSVYLSVSVYVPGFVCVAVCMYSPSYVMTMIDVLCHGRRPSSTRWRKNVTFLFSQYIYQTLTTSRYRNGFTTQQQQKARFS